MKGKHVGGGGTPLGWGGVGNRREREGATTLRVGELPLDVNIANFMCIISIILLL